MLVRLVLVVFVVGIGTYLIRALPLVLGSHATPPAWLARWLTFVAPAVLGALLGPALLLPDGRWLVPWQNASLLAAMPTALIAWRWRSLPLTVLSGVLCFAVIRALVS